MADANTYRFSGQEYHQPSGLCIYLYRAYDPNLHRWLNRDPIGEAGGLNLYTFVGNDPVDYIDPFGLDRIVGWYGGNPIIVKDNPVPGQNPFVPDGRENIGNMIGAEYGKGLLQMAASEAAGQALGAGFRLLTRCKPLIPVSRWGRAGLEPGDWVMKGPVSPYNYLMSGKYQPLSWPGNNIPAPYMSGVAYNVPPTSLSWPTGPLGTVKGLIGQRIYTP